jgi:ADP-L-glycero-D-manno-heptose 6-epimerase
MIVVTGAAGFIGSCMIRHLLDTGYTDILAVDDFQRTDKAPNLEGKPLVGQLERMNFPRWLERNYADVEAVIHLGARTDTTEMSTAIFDQLNVEYSKAVWMVCAGFGIPLLYASSAATYGLGESGYDDNHATIPDLKPLNPYGQSKQDFDIWALDQIAAGATPKHWYGFKFFNVYGPNEYHKGRMASVIFHTVRQIKASGKMQLFRSHRPDYADGAQSRDFIYVKDVCAVLQHFLEQRPTTGIYNLGTGQARSFLDLATGTFKALGLEPDISFVDTPADIRDKYQYFTEANMRKVRHTGYIEPFYSLEDGIADYVGRYLREERYW